MNNMYLVRAETNSQYFQEFEENNIIAINWNELGDLNRFKSKKELKQAVNETYVEENKYQRGLSVGTLYTFYNEMKINDYVVSYNQSTRQYIVGKIKSDYKYNPEGLKTSEKAVNQREVNWLGKISRDDLKPHTKNKLGSLLTLFSINDVKQEIINTLNKKPKEINEEMEEGEIEQLKEDIINQSFEIIKDKVMELNWEEMEELVAGLLRGMGYRTIVSKKGKDKGRDIIASPDGLGLEDPRIIVQVKHRKSLMGAPDIRNFLGVLNSGDKGLFVSTGGFTQEAGYEADRSSLNPVTLMDIDMLVEFIIQYYDNFDNDARNLIPLTKIYYPIKT